MKYRSFGKTGIRVSALGFGCMRFPTVEKDEKRVIDRQRAITMLRNAIDNGVNYVDTAYPYHGGESEEVVGIALEDGYRDKVYLADKCPVWLLKKEEDFDRILDEQLAKLKTDHIDFYLLHALDGNRFENTVKKFHLISHMEKAKEEGKIRHLGFSFHDNLDSFKKIIDAYDGWEFCQIQYNYVDVCHQAGTEGLRYAAGKGLGVVIMEPLRGGKLADVSLHLAETFPAGKTPVEWALDFIWDQPEVSLLLSGMSAEKQVEDNLLYADRSGAGMLTEEERAVFGKAKEIFDTMALVKCTKCRYCMPCPSGLDIPGIFSIYNRVPVDGKEAAAKDYAVLDVKADACVACKRCEKACPQHINISGEMQVIRETFEESGN
ncbi:MAG TPA: aldo/keto reductase [Candidatus Limivivens intestinipullorum]|uniref:Aldo/keto reductase n=1 Tax=Candidatus Limivivens intestinipullorum TaxID=2840858 RepID=A0A9D1JJY9_9FIRM|nr:aldo/keto reductase [Candidatus Limivivens intestinipullorum]